MLKKITSNIKKRPILYTIILLTIIIIGIVLVFKNGKSTEETMIVTKGEFLNEVSASGRVVASQNSILGFDQSGRIASVNVSVGDKITAGTILASIDNGSARAEIAQKLASLEREKADLSALYKGTRPEQLAITKQKYIDATSALIIAMRNVYLETEDALLSDIDSLFKNGNSVNPDILIRTHDQKEERSIENDRVVVGEKLRKWKQAFASLSASSSAVDVTSARTIANESLDTIQQFIDRMALIANNVTTGNSGNSQAEIDADRSTVNGAGQSVSSARSSEQTAYASWTVASNNLALENSGSTAEDIVAQEAQVKVAEADLASAQAQLRKTAIIAPFDGTVTKMDIKIGEIISPSDTSIAMIGDGLFEIESYIPEVSIARLSIDNPATITLDAYGSDIEFYAKVIAIDPAETIRDGVSTYKTTLRFDKEDPRIKSGMTANIRIISERKSDTIIIPKSIILDRDGAKYVRVKNGELIVETLVETGSVTALGQVEIISGLSEGDVIVLPPLIQ